MMQKSSNIRLSKLKIGKNSANNAILGTKKA